MRARENIPAALALLALAIVALFIYKQQIFFFKEYTIIILIAGMAIVLSSLFVVTRLSSSILLVHLVEHPLVRLMISVIVGLLVMEILNFLNEWNFLLGFLFGALCYIELRDAVLCGISSKNDDVKP